MTDARRGVLTVLGIAILCIAAALSIAYATAYRAMPRIPNTGASATQRYVNPLFGFSFDYDGPYIVRELTPRDVVVGTSGADIAEAVVISQDASSTYPSFSNFAHETARFVCGVACGDIARTYSYQSAAGDMGEEFYFERTASEGEVGPFYAFDLSSERSGAVYTELLIHSPSTYPSAEAASLLSDMANSLRVVHE